MIFCFYEYRIFLFINIVNKFRRGCEVSNIHFLKNGMVLVFLLFSGCSPKYSIESVRSAAYRPTAQKIFIVANLGETMSPNDPLLFQNSMKTILDLCGIDVGFEMVNMLSFQQQIEKSIKDFSPDLIMSILPSEIDGAIVGNYYIQVNEFPSRSTVWKAEIGISGYDKVQSFSSAIIERMRIDNILPASCSGVVGGKKQL